MRAFFFGGSHRTQVFYPNLGLIWEILVSDLFMAVPVGQNISGLPNLDLALTYANITTGRMLWQYFKFVRKYACCTNSLSDLAYAMYLRRSQPFASAVPGRLPAKDMHRTPDYWWRGLRSNLSFLYAKLPRIGVRCMGAGQAFMTTDTFPKLRARTFVIGGREYRMAGMD